MSKPVRKIRFLDGWRIGENESWFSDMASEGLHLKKLGWTVAVFEWGEPTHDRYRIDFSYNKNEPEMQRELYAECGWECVCGFNLMNVYRSPEESDAAELHTDPTEQAYTLKKLSRNLIINGAIVTVLIIAALCMMAFAAFVGKTPVLTFVEGRNASMPIAAAIYLYMVFQSIRSALSMKNLVHSLSEGKEINHNADWKHSYRASKLIQSTIIIIGILSIALPIAQLALWNVETLPIDNDNQTYLRLADIEKAPELQRIMRYEDVCIDWNNNVKSEWSPYAPIMLEIHEEGVLPGKMWDDNGGEYSPSISYNLYKLRFRQMSNGVINDLRKRYEPYYQEPFVEESGYPGFDRFLIRSDVNRDEVLAGKDEVVIHFVYYGDKSYDDVIQAVSEYLGRF